MASVGNASKRRRAALARTLAELKSINHISAKALKNVINATKENKVLASSDVGFHHVRDCFNTDEIHSLLCVEPMPFADDRRGTWNWEFLHPSKLVSMVLESSPHAQARFSQALERHGNSPSQPWDLILAFDEFSAGNPLAAIQSRKTMVISMTFAQLGPSAWADENMW